MSLIGVLRSGVSGMNAQSNRISTVAENIQNSGTTGYKRSSAEFSSLLIADSAGGNYNSGSVETKVRRSVTEGGTLNATTSKSDLAIDGNGFFVVKDPSSAPYLTRAGNFKVDGVTGNFSNAAGMTLMGYSLLDGEPNPTLNSVTDMVPINLASVSTRATPTTEASLSGKLPLDGAVTPGGQYAKKYSLVTYDKLGKSQTLDVYLSKNTGGTWTASIYNAAANPTPAGSTPALPAAGQLGTATLSFDAQGRLAGGGQQPVPDAVVERPRGLGLGGLDQEGLRREVELAQRRRRLLGLEDVALQQEGGVVHELDRHLPVDPQHGAVDVDPFPGSQRQAHGAAHRSPSRIEVFTSISAARLRSGERRTSPASCIVQAPICTRSARREAGRAFSGSSRSAIRTFQSSCTKPTAAVRSGPDRPRASTSRRRVRARSKAARSRSRPTSGASSRISE